MPTLGGADKTDAMVVVVVFRLPLSSVKIWATLQLLGLHTIEGLSLDISQITHNPIKAFIQLKSGQNKAFEAGADQRSYFSGARAPAPYMLKPLASSRDSRSLPPKSTSNHNHYDNDK